jgi:hypothetical protein
VCRRLPRLEDEDASVQWSSQLDIRRPTEYRDISDRGVQVQLCTDLGDEECGKEHSDAYFGDRGCRLPIKELELSGNNTIEDGKQYSKTGLQSTQESW